ncbi:hypothetical protein LJ655_03895 [Paraburkholderia sp. MMS20-SJTN17]|uniref:Uncharacterized protein n=1 Tax=Paraburkholderia translucens TaxID=2886945 RepID=A0ABS8K8I2_9BURK|nr:hypothetical protein [Paraburkholderia sp. MMS20-SJTN17]MCC8401043.1 hypothetical protein [Paraburkholderia sp. MMS20-SJTN17]
MQLKSVLGRAGLECDRPDSHYLTKDDLTTSARIPAIELAAAEISLLAVGRKCLKLAFPAR